MTDREQLLFFSSPSLLGRVGNMGLALMGPVGFPALSGLILWGMMRSPLPSSYLHGAFAAAVALLYMSPGPLWAFEIGCVGTAAGFLGFLLTDSTASKAIFISNSALIWLVFWAMSRIHGQYLSARRGLEEECDRLDLEISRASSEVQSMRTAVGDARKRIAAYNRLETFSDELIGAHSQQELIFRARKALRELFPLTEAFIQMFPLKNSPAREDAWGQRAVQDARPVLFTSRTAPLPTLALGRFIFIPMVMDKSVAGWAGLETEEEESFDINDLRLSVIAVNLVTLALQNADLYAQTQALATSDSLTGLYTRGYFDERFEEEFVKARHKSHALSLLIIDIDYFKKVNDVHGHHLGDDILRWLSRIIANGARETDFVARYGGDEFVVLMPHTRGKEALDFGRRLQKEIAEARFRWGEEKVRLAISGGVASLEAAHKDKMDLIREADRALYKAKEGGRNQVVSL